jgi:hypothetical protein
MRSCKIKKERQGRFALPQTDHVRHATAGPSPKHRFDAPPRPADGGNRMGHRQGTVDLRRPRSVLKMRDDLVLVERRRLEKSGVVNEFVEGGAFCVDRRDRGEQAVGRRSAREFVVGNAGFIFGDPAHGDVRAVAARLEGA